MKARRNDQREPAGSRGPHRRFQELRPDEELLREVLAAGASRARETARETMARVRDAIGSGARLTSRRLATAR